MSILTLNCGSSSVKFSVWDPDTRAFVCRGVVERVGQPGSRLEMAVNGDAHAIERDCASHSEAVELMLGVLTEGDDSPLADRGAIRGVGHRVVHGGEQFRSSALITPEMLEVLEEVAELAPLHNPPNLAGIHACDKALPGIPDVAVFDTAFHQTMPPEAYIYPLPYEWYEKWGIRRYGFHGTSHLYVTQRAAAVMGRPLSELKLVSLHVGNGASAAAVAHGKSVDTSMGLTPLEGLVMGTRCGWIDPAIPLFMMVHKGLSTQEMDSALNKGSGLLGISGRSPDRRDILAAADEGDERCALAVKIEARSLAKTIGMYAAAMGGLDGVVFTAGVGENAASIRAAALEGLGFLGIELDPDKNARAVGGQREEVITTDDSRVQALVIPTNEELVIAEDTQAVIDGRLGQPDFRYSFSP